MSTWISHRNFQPVVLGITGQVFLNHFSPPWSKVPIQNFWLRCDQMHYTNTRNNDIHSHHGCKFRFGTFDCSARISKWNFRPEVPGITCHFFCTILVHHGRKFRFGTFDSGATNRGKMEKLNKILNWYKFYVEHFKGITAIYFCLPIFFFKLPIVSFFETWLLLLQHALHLRRHHSLYY